MGEVPESPRAAAVRRQLIDLVRSQGPGLLDDSRRVRAMLADAVAGATAEANLIALALASGVPARLRDAERDPRGPASAMDAIAQDLHRGSSVQPADAIWAVESIAASLGMLTMSAAPSRAGAQAANPPSPAPAPGSGPGPNDLVIRVGERQHVAPASTVVTIGRDPDCTITVDSPAVSRLHARVSYGPGGWELHDEGSTQGSFVNGVAVTTAALRGDTTVTLGQGEHAVVVRFAPFGEAMTRAPQRPRPAQATELPGARPGGALAGGAPATELGGGGPAGPPLTVTLNGTTRTLRPGSSLTIGREDDNDLVAPQTTVSRHHARIEHAGGAWRLNDLGSTSGTWLNGTRLTAPATLSGRQDFVLGDAGSGDRLRTETARNGSEGVRPTGRTAVRTVGSRRRLAVAGAVALVLALVVSGLGLWWFLGGTPEPEGPDPAPAPEAVTVSRDDLARATVQLSTDSGRGSGVVIDSEQGLILTNAHVAAPSAPGLGVFLGEFSDDQDPNPDEIRVDVSDGLDESAEPRFWAELVAVDGYLDVAVIRVRSKLSGAPAEEDDLDQLTEVPLGDSDELGTSDEISFYGYPAASESSAPTFTTGVVSGPVQDERLDQFRAVINTTADLSPGNSGGPAVDESGHVVGVATWRTFNDRGETAFSRIRPINLAKPVIDAALAGETYRSPWARRGPRSARMPFWDYGAPGTRGAVDEECRDAGPGASPTTINMDYKGFPRGERHTDVMATLSVPSGGDWVPVAWSSSPYPTRLPPKGCLSLTFSEDVVPGTYRLRIGVGGDLRVVIDMADFTIE
ncbi:FHA domain-containing protein [Nocardioides eburneiflavus]|uniref:FHA domain-containing protein n=1 Tax=Nocardioides eburneiflavus TaxID=2518372 RepID=A0A4Z1CDT2_9ACTN|nr:FHA domain-containing protein [Nocardioides eburneiflavus]TGN62647.1 FHA domain-containing protein [Nocardioides eburneiflavus]